MGRRSRKSLPSVPQDAMDTPALTCVVFVGCAPLGRPAAHIDTVLQSVYESVAQEPDKETGEPPGHWLLHGYSRGPQLVCARMAAFNHRHGPLQGFVTMERNHPLAGYVGQLFPGAMIVR